MIQSFSTQAVRGTLWSYFSFFSGKLLNFISTLILARLLVPEQFGLVGYCTLAIQYLDIINTAGLDSALIARKDKLEKAANSVFIVSIFLGLISFVISWFSAPFLADFFHQEEVTDLFRVLSLSLPISSLGLVPGAILRRNLEFRRRVISDVVRTLSKGLTAVSLALAGWGPWSLVIGQLMGEFAGAIISWVFAGWRPSREFDPEVTRQVTIFGFHIVLVNLAGAFRSNVDYLLVGRILGAEALGVYTMAYRVPELIIGSINMVVTSVTFPMLAHAQHDFDSLRSVYYGYIRYIALFAYLVAFGLTLVSRQFVETFLSAQWNGMILPMSLIAIAFAVKAVAFVPGVLYKAVGRPDILNRISLIQLPIVLGVLLYCTRWGIIGVAAGQIGLAIINLVIVTIVINRVMNLHFRELLESLAPAFVSSVIMIAAVRVFQVSFELSGIAGLLTYAFLGGVTYMGVLGLINREIIKGAFTTLRAAFSRS